ncbi:eukaryotic initiation factor 4E member 2-like protein [Naegleria gruberi]|uniref:Eukaryotic initiation factor 4E member 2-like protein n=1 Tax=Naegleria gruberi TaxID=5762 RepID=D2VEL1_NAEGR|nr:eukaryotic initiation factor 4E member 2-like protein [Naegleria gruberi]EFC44903.1 eukaryotic initiation factor 4E member 2-like protein [Naegleria gruberi]|eukprot:XP_002677647.1 eukaryotic initiation factor 4E member 2-like protein [Naegleria gruberi strain NEG-M]
MSTSQQEVVSETVFEVPQPAKKTKSQSYDSDEQLKAKGFPLETKWTFWYANTKVDKEGHHHQEHHEKEKDGSQYRDCLTKLATVSSIDEFCKVYSYLQKPSKLPKNSNISLFRHEVVPMWESFPQGGCWMVKIRKGENGQTSTFCDRLWEQLVFSTICEQFETGNVVGCVLSLRTKEDVLQVWNKNSNNHADRIHICDRFKWILHFGEGVIVQYKHNKLSIKDGSTFRNARTFLVHNSETSNTFNSIDDEAEKTPTTTN